MQVKVNGKILTWLLIGILIGVLIPLSVFYTNTIVSKPEETGGEGNTTIIRIYRGLKQFEAITETFYFLDIEHRIYPESIVVQYGSTVTLWLRYYCYFGTAGDWNVSASENLELIVEVPRTPSGCSIQSELVFTSARDFEVTMRFSNPNPEPWNVGRPLVTVRGVFLGQPSNPDIGTPDIVVTIEAYIS